MSKVAVVTGSSSSIGYETSLFLGRNQFATYGKERFHTSMIYKLQEMRLLSIENH